MERRNGFFETSFLPGRTFTGPGDFNDQFTDWIGTKANRRHLRAIGATPLERWDDDKAAMVALPPFSPPVGLTNRIRLGRDYYVRIGSNECSVDPSAIGGFVSLSATPDVGAVTCEGRVVATHARYWGRGATITDAAHVATARELRGSFAATRAAAAARKTTRVHGDGHVVALRALPDYDDLFGVDFHHTPDVQGVISS